MKPETNVAAMRGDCARCAALCCVAYAFDRSQDFAIDKPNGLPCPHLNGCNRCTIYRERAQTGFGACIDYDCLGAGQRVTQEVFGGRSWRDEPQLLPAMITAFITMSTIHHLLVLLDRAAGLPLNDFERQTLRTLKERLNPASGWACASLTAFERGTCETDSRAFLTSLRHHVHINRDRIGPFD